MTMDLVVVMDVTQRLIDALLVRIEIVDRTLGKTK